MLVGYISHDEITALLACFWSSPDDRRRCSAFPDDDQGLYLDLLLELFLLGDFLCWVGDCDGWVYKFHNEVLGIKKLCGDLISTEHE